MNLLSAANWAIGGLLNANIKVTLIRCDAVWTDGVAEYEETRPEVFAQVQPVKAEVVAKDTYLQGVDVRNFWIMGKRRMLTIFLNPPQKPTPL